MRYMLLDSPMIELSDGSTIKLVGTVKVLGTEHPCNFGFAPEAGPNAWEVILAKKGLTIHAIREYRERNKASLREAKQAIDACIGK